ncbi:MAG: Nickel-transporting ATPase Sulfate-transporting ATPase [Chitinophagaceae bacterium]|nr:Nickel-transporting ATPase Sulfate-transporting ATPase [Chitinophagaceae bacterium]
MLPLLQIKNLSVDFETEHGSTSAVKNISLEINKGEIVAIVGESGSGKTVTSLSILQLLQTPPAKYTSGEILFLKNGNQTDLLKLPGQEMRAIRGNEIAMIFQEPMTSLNPVQTCGSQVMEAIQLHEKKDSTSARKKTIQLFEEVQLPDPENILNRYPHQLSGGQKQRVMIAMAMSCNPSLLIADEPTTALDVTVQKTILQLIKNLQQQHEMGVIYITHDLSLVAEIADKVIVMYKGSVVEAGSVKDIFLNAQHPYTKALLACRPVLHSKGKRLPVVSDFLDKEPVNGQWSMANSEKEIHSTSNIKHRTSDIQSLTPLLKVQNLKVYFPARKNFFGKTLLEFKAVDDVSFEIMKGETVGLVGESGCGKTTLGRALIRLIEPTAGNILFDGKDIAHIEKGEMRRMRKDIQIIFQDPYGSLNPRITIGSAIQEPMKIHGLLQNNKQRKDKVIELLEKVNLKPEHFNRYPHEFSGGQRQRICIARALGLNPEFLICDESVSALDVSVQAQVLNLLNDLKKEFGFTSIFISHDLSVVRYISDRIMVMNKGKIEESGTADEVYFHPKKEYTKKLIASIPKGLVV